MSEELKQELEQEEQPVVVQGVHNYSSEDHYVRPEEPELQERLEWFQDQKLGLMMHWGTYSQIGIVESWALSDVDVEWSRNEVDWDVTDEDLKRQYFELNKSFNPLRFQPDKWAELAAEGGFKYLIFTTKHHDGFCMWDTHTTDYRVTHKDCPFHGHKYADVTREVFDAFRAKGIAIAAYFSKADWHTPTYWAPGMERGTTTSRGPSYDPEKYPWLWNDFIQFTHDQIEELLTRYGRIDILWLDAGWVGKGKQDILLGDIVDRMRQHQPWLLVADRTIGGKYENYVTPEQTIPERPVMVPWESCITMGRAFSYRFDDEYKSTRELIHMLLEIVAKGGNLALNVTPQPDGRLPVQAITRMKEIGAWMNVHGEGIYGTRVCAPYVTDNVAFTHKDDTVYAFRMYGENEQATATVHLPYTENVKQIDLLGGADNLSFEKTENGIVVTLPADTDVAAPPIAHGFRIR
ncbi:alpha-L-fucosidase [Paenibacillus aquistagni]|uniref:alpha-L-fucosidase n=1 Tax=Paenibacillus aquistagni TaxID=1852522 RepID=A0A1X7KCY7_9BACL|nr:alpha-L-fucosidase [Paenibacillus aquistagni]SMG39076.1 alpha-L-fucosidase [Paenibacillus aquistagni]